MSNKERVIGLYQAYATGDASRIGAFLHEDAVWVAPPGNATQVALGYGTGDEAGPPDGSNNLIGRETIAGFMARDFGRLFANPSNKVRGLYGDGDHVVIEHRLSATFPNGRPYVNDYCFVFDFRDGLVSRIREYMDTRGGWVQAFGNGPGQTLVTPG